MTETCNEINTTKSTNIAIFIKSKQSTCFKRVQREDTEKSFSPRFFAFTRDLQYSRAKKGKFSNLIKLRPNSDLTQSSTTIKFPFYIANIEPC